MKYDTQLGDLKNQLNVAKNVLIVLPTQLNIDKLASGLALYLSLKQSGKQASIATEGTPLVAHSNLYGIGDVKNSLSIASSGGDNFIVTLDGVVDPNGQIPSLEKLDWYPEGANLNLVFHVLPGQKFEPKNVSSKFQGGSGSFDLVFVLGTTSLNELGNLYAQNTQIFQNIVNIDLNPANSNFGKVNVIDPNSSSLSEIISQVLPSLGLPIDMDIASNLLAGIYDATANLTTNVKPDTFIAIGQAMQVGGKVPSATSSQPQPIVQTQLAPVATPPSSQGFDLRQVFQSPVNPMPQPQESFTTPQVASIPASTPSAEERPTGEYATSASPETSPAPDWLTPKIYKGSGSVG